MTTHCRTRKSERDAPDTDVVLEAMQLMEGLSIKKLMAANFGPAKLQVFLQLSNASPSRVCDEHKARAALRPPRLGLLVRRRCKFVNMTRTRHLLGVRST